MLHFQIWLVVLWILPSTILAQVCDVTLCQNTLIFNNANSIVYNSCSVPECAGCTPCVVSPNNIPASQPTPIPSAPPSYSPTGQPSSEPSRSPSTEPSSLPSMNPSSLPSCSPSMAPSTQPSSSPSCEPTRIPSSQPSNKPSSRPSTQPTSLPSAQPSQRPTSQPSCQPSGSPSAQPSTQPSSTPTSQPSLEPSNQPTSQPSSSPSSQPSSQPSSEPSFQPSTQPSTTPSSQPSSMPTSSPSYIIESYGQVVYDRRRFRKGGACENQCSGHGTCEKNFNCKCYVGLDGDEQWTGPDCSLRTCPKDYAWVDRVAVNANDMHPRVECSNKGVCERSLGICLCFPGYEGVACQRTICPNQCNNRGTCNTEKALANSADRVYSKAWDAIKTVGCLCDKGYRGPACDLQECPTGPDPLTGYGGESGRDCSGRGICDYSEGVCQCFEGFEGSRCEIQHTLV